MIHCAARACQRSETILRRGSIASNSFREKDHDFEKTIPTSGVKVTLTRKKGSKKSSHDRAKRNKAIKQDLDLLKDEIEKCGSM